MGAAGAAAAVKLAMVAAARADDVVLLGLSKGVTGFFLAEQPDIVVNAGDGSPSCSKGGIRPLLEDLTEL